MRAFCLSSFSAQSQARQGRGRDLQAYLVFSLPLRAQRLRTRCSLVTCHCFPCVVRGQSCDCKCVTAQSCQPVARCLVSRGNWIALRVTDRGARGSAVKHHRHCQCNCHHHHRHHCLHRHHHRRRHHHLRLGSASITPRRSLIVVG